MKTMEVIKLNTEMEAATAALWCKPKYKDLSCAISKTYFQQQQQKLQVIQKRRSRRRMGRILRKHTGGRDCLPVGPGAGFSTQKLQNSHFKCV